VAGAGDAEVERGLVFLFQGVLQAQVPDGIGVKDDSGHQGGGKDDAQRNRREQHAVRSDARDREAQER
jgi:hypothetical protein